MPGRNVTPRSAGSTAPTGRDRERRDNEVVVYTAEYYKKKPSFKNGVDVSIVNGKVTAIQDRAGAVCAESVSGAVSFDRDAQTLERVPCARRATFFRKGSRTNRAANRPTNQCRR